MKKYSLYATGLLIAFSFISLAEDKTVYTKNTQIISSEKSATQLLSQSELSLDARISVVESYAIMGESTPGLQEREAMEAKQSNARLEIQEKAKELEKGRSEYAKKASAMTDSARKAEELRLAKMERDLNDLAQEKGEELKQEMQIATERLMQELESAVTELAQENNLDIVVDKITGRILYVSDKFDLTDRAIDKVNKRHEIKLAENQKNIDAKKVVVAENKHTDAKSVVKKTV